MNWEAVGAVAELVGALAVVASLVYVAVQIRHNTAAARGSTLQAISDAHTSYFVVLGTDPAFAELSVRLFRDGAGMEDLTPEESARLSLSLMGWVGMLENTYLQHRLGLVPDSVFRSYGWNNGIHRTRYFAEWWTHMATLFVSPEFKEFFEGRVQIGPDAALPIR